METKISELAKKWVKAVRLAGKYEGLNHQFYAQNRIKADKLLTQLINLGFDFSTINRKKV